MNPLVQEFKTAFLQVRFEGEQILAQFPHLLLLKISLTFFLSAALLVLSMIVISAGYVEDGFYAGLISCLGIFLSAYLHGVYERSKTGFYDQSFRSDIYHPE